MRKYFVLFPLCHHCRITDRVESLALASHWSPSHNSASDWPNVWADHSPGLSRLVFILDTQVINPVRTEHDVGCQEVWQRQEQHLDDIVDGVGCVGDSQLHGHVHRDVLAGERDVRAPGPANNYRIMNSLTALSHNLSHFVTLFLSLLHLQRKQLIVK